MIDPVSLAVTTAAKPPTSTASDAVAQMAADFSSHLKQAESISAAGLAGQAGPREVTNAVMQADRSLATAVAVRDKIVSAFLEVSRMAI
ncbi:flagellar hook-basal body complex protein FliE [Rhizobiaceae bacterium]|nr:flagellar hook-basal body complex protein FliE [Rhizobiaceae bacterium]